MKVYEVQKRSALGVYQEKHGFDNFIDDYMKYVVDVFPPEVIDMHMSLIGRTKECLWSLLLNMIAQLCMDG
jgi:hypothetical protein